VRVGVIGFELEYSPVMGLGGLHPFRAVVPCSFVENSRSVHFVVRGAEFFALNGQWLPLKIRIPVVT